MPLSVLQDKVDVKELNTSKNLGCQYALYSIIWGLARKDSVKLQTFHRLLNR